MQHNQKIMFMIGGPGSGKGTQSNIIKEQLNYHHISTGDLVRQMISNGEAEHDSSELAISIQEATLAGKLLPDQFVLDLVKKEISQHPEVAGFIIDGYPRTLNQAKLFEEHIGKQDHTIYLDAPEEELTKRLLARAEIEHRADDNDETIKCRIQTYNEKTKPVVDYLRASSPGSFMEVDAMGDGIAVNKRITAAMQQDSMTSIGLYELIKLYWTSGTFADAVSELGKKYGSDDFEVTFAYIPLMYILQGKESVKSILRANTRTGFQNNNFDMTHGHNLNINATQAFNSSNDMSHNPLWKNIHKGLLKGIGDRDLIQKLIDKHIHLLFTKNTFTLDKAMEKCLLSFWCEYIFGPEVDPKAFAKTRKKLLEAMKYAFYNNSQKNTPVLGELTCRFYGWLKGDKFKQVDTELNEYLSQSSSGLLYKFRQALIESNDFPEDKIDQAVLDNAFDFVLVFDFINNALYESMASVVKDKINSDKQRRDSFAPGLRNAFLFPYRVRVPQQSININDKSIAQGSYVFIHLVKSGLYHSYGPRACVGNSVTQWIVDRFFDHLKGMEFDIVKTTMPKDRETPRAADVPMSPERYEVSWKYPRDYLQKQLPSYAFKNVGHFYDVLKSFEDPRLFGYVVSSLVEKIEKMNIDHDKLVIVAPEVRGIPIAAAIARELDARQVYIRKPGKIPGPVLSREYQNAYSDETLEISKNADLKGKQVILIDDGIASGGTIKVCCELIETLGGNVNSIMGMIDHRYKQKNPALAAYDGRIHTLFDFEQVIPSNARVTPSLALAS